MFIFIETLVKIKLINKKKFKMKINERLLKFIL